MRALSLIIILPILACARHMAPGAQHAGADATRSELGKLQLQQGYAEAQPTRHLIRRGTVAVSVENIDASRARFERSLASLGGQVSRLDLDEQKRAYIIVRVPPDRLEALMDSAAVLGKVAHRGVSAEDVTEQVVDAEARLAVLRASRDRLKLLIDRAASVADVVAVEHELSRVQSQLESLEARLNSLRGQVGFSELSVNMSRRPVLGPLGLLAQGIGIVISKLFVWR